MAADLPNLQINANAVQAPHLPSLPTPRVFTPEVATPQVGRNQFAELPSPLRDVSNSLSKASDEANDVAKLYAKQAGYQAVQRDDQGNLVIAKAPIVGDAAVAYQSAVKYAALTFGENEAKREDLVLSRQFHNDPDGYLQASRAFAQKHVQQFAQAAGPDVAAALQHSIENNITTNYRFLVVEQQKNIKHNFDQGTKAQMESLETDILSQIESGDKGSPTLQRNIDQYIQTNKLRVQNPVLGESPDVAALRLKGFDLRVGAARYVSGLKTILNSPEGGVQAATEALESHLKEQGLSPTQRALDYQEGQKAIKDHVQNIQRNISLADKARKISDEQEEDRIIKDSSSPNPTVTENEIKTNPRMSPEAKMRMLGWIKRDGMPEPLAQVSQAKSMDLFRRMNLAEGDPDRIADLSPIRQAYINGELKRQDEEWLETRFKEARTPEGQKLTDIRTQFNKAVEPTIDTSNPLMARLDHTGKLENYRFQRYVDTKVEQYRAEGKNPYDLFDPSKPDYLGKPEVLRPYQKTIGQSTETLNENFRRSATPAPRPQRNPGESAADYLNRTGVK